VWLSVGALVHRCVVIGVRFLLVFLTDCLPRWDRGGISFWEREDGRKKCRQPVTSGDKVVASCHRLSPIFG